MCAYFVDLINLQDIQRVFFAKEATQMVYRCFGLILKLGKMFPNLRFDPSLVYILDIDILSTFPIGMYLFCIFDIFDIFVNFAISNIHNIFGVSINSRSFLITEVFDYTFLII